MGEPPLSQVVGQIVKEEGSENITAADEVFYGRRAVVMIKEEGVFLSRGIGRPRRIY